MKKKSRTGRNVWLLPIFFLALIAFLWGCGKKAVVPNPPEAEQNAIRTIAVLPVINKTNEVNAARMLREKVIEEVRFKGYRRLSSQETDRKLSGICPEGTKAPPSVAGEALGADAALYCTLLEWKHSSFLAYSKSTAVVQFELRNTRTGERIWTVEERAARRNFEMFKRESELATLHDYEGIVRDIVEKAFIKFPEGPEFVADMPKKKGRFWDMF
ncbi:MAG: DUF799 family lipoprotein [Syntrophales bacterium]|nr:DUF799 family lipoprotein [Syntrophales bacterium]MDD5234310.1 DUF799 family lipoprotein [Syntrophales bacterium]MDD5532486.1 DUF799 family lipoprotein [Syntrophales bacterium]HPL63344.1 DUF799 family lipoprotein [Syntrophales bacterium]